LDYAARPLTLPSYDLATIAALLSRLPSPPEAEDTGLRAAVAAILRDPGDGRDAEVLLIRRAERTGDPWSGHMAFPGGRQDLDDPDLHITAIRETREEVGIDLVAQGALLARLPDLPAIARGKRTGLTITPFVFALRGDVEMVFDTGEVAEALWAPVGPMARGEGAGTYDYVLEERTIALPCIRLGERVVWGLTHRMLEMFFEALRAAHR
jgi:8-oxo-dGTP pyrophosphatase MutT (NUDIX family)